ncbi:IclR family transcriptional regulator [Paeniglutamicibacter psychrophenolicus]|uniref:IclR family transcriptional regulator n=1 Tax=Paeniglutamicibacter psychrophenolicus TaxID=257454 RepID=UPI002783F398|nr:IclR family transcriptional regulator [Paeniglutamicibacter psychrophenolicus]MDQ0093736.1 DNA-binding IclR family transcriptional regulator [Paeniglutamicibacter psychrophenolicus]
MAVDEPQGTETDGDDAVPGGVQSVDRALAILEILGRDGSSGVGEVAEELDIHKSTASRLLSSLLARGMVQQNTNRGKYELGFGILKLASSIPGRLSLVGEARPVLEGLAEEYKETVNLAVLREEYAVNVDQAMGPSTLATYDWLGSLTPLHATSSGKVLLAALGADERGRILKAAKLPQRTAKTVRTRTALEKELLQVVKNGFAQAREEFEMGINSVAVPVRNHLGAVVGAVSISGPAFRFDPEKQPGLLEGLKRAGLEISASLGYTDR